jgi:3-oxoadipate enol-lactonase
MPLADTGEVQLSYERTGSGPPLLLIMGMSGTALHWGEPFLELLRASFEVIVYDHRGVGESTRVEGAFTIADLAEDAAGLLTALELDSAHVLGISMGGMIAQELVLAQPERVRTLALGCTFCGGEGSSLASLEVLQRLSHGMMSGDRELARQIAWEVNVSAEKAADETAAAAFADISRRRAVAAAVIMSQMRAIGRHNTSERLSTVSTPTLVMHGSADQMIPASNGALIASLIPGARLEIFDGVGHLFFWEVPERAAELIRELAVLPV